MRFVKCGWDDAPGIPGSGSHSLAIYGPTLLVDIGFDPSYDGSIPNPSVPPLAGMRGVGALVDTGATESCIDNQLAIDLLLPVIDRRKIGGVGGAHEVNVYLAQIHVPLLKSTLNGTFCGVHLAAGGQVHRALIGRTFLAHFTMTYEGKTGTVTLSAL